MTFTVDGVERVHTITTSVFKPDGTLQFLSAQARASAGSTAVAYLDDYRTSANAPLVAGDTVTVSGGGSSGCSIAGGRGVTDWSFVIMGLVAWFAYLRRRRVNN